MNSIKDIIKEYHLMGLNQTPLQNIEKSASISEQERQKGNDLFRKKKHSKSIHVEVLSYYSKSIAFAPSESEEMAAAIANRSALLYHLKKYDLCIHETDKALHITKNATLRIKLLCRKGECLRCIDEASEADAIFKEATHWMEFVDEDESDMNKLRELIIKSREKKIETLKKESDDQKKLKLPEMIPSKEISCASEAIQLQYNKKYGRHFVSTRDIQTGEVLIMEEGYACSPLLNQIYLVCSHCLTGTWTSIPCDYCSHAIYCSHSCKKNAWNRYHEAECPVLTVLLDSMNINGYAWFSTVLRILITALKEREINCDIDSIITEYKNSNRITDERKIEFSEDGIFHSNTFKAVCGLIAHSKKKSEEPDYNEKAVLFWKMIAIIFDKELKNEPPENSDSYKLLIEAIIKIMKIVEFNNFVYQGYECYCPDYRGFNEHEPYCIQESGIILAPCSSLINHSCVHNTEKIFVDGKVVLLAVQPIKQGEQIFYNYAYGIESDRSKRQTYLEREYFFTCDCIACSEKWPCFSADELAKAINTFRNWLMNRNESFQNMLSCPPSEWHHSKDFIPILCEAIDEIYANNNFLKATIKSLQHKSVLKKCFLKFYGIHLNMPEKC